LATLRITFWQNWKNLVIKALSLAFGQLGDPRIQKVIGFSIGLAIAVFIGVMVLAWYLIGAFSGLEGWWGDAAQILGTFAALVVAWFTFPMVAVATAALFSDQVIDAVIARHYPGTATPHQVSVPAAIFDGLKMAVIALVANILLLPLLFVAPVYAACAYALNGYLLGREYFEMPAYRRLARPAARDIFRRHRGRFILAGIVIAFLSTIPFLNLIAPVIGIAFMVHIFESVVNLEMRRG
jgi:CysZ protein